MHTLYIDPGTGSMLFTILVGVFGAAFFAFRKLFLKLSFSLKNVKKAKIAIDTDMDYVIFSDNKRYWNVFEPICDEFENRRIPLVYMTASPDDPALQKSYNYVNCRFIGEGNKAFVTLNILKARILLATTPGLDVYQWKRSKDTKYYVHIPHAISDITLYRMFGIDYYDSILITGPFQEQQVRKLEELRNLPQKEIVVVGQPYMDEIKKRIETAEIRKNDIITVLLAPSWGESSILNRYGERIINALLETGYHIIIRPHPQSFISEKEMLDNLMQEFKEKENLEWNRDNDNFEVLYKSDILISDFSGVIFDFALGFDKPVIYADTSFDKAPYDASWIDEELWTFKVLSEIGIELKEEGFDNLKNIISISIESKKLMESRGKAKTESWANIGKSAEVIVNYLVKKNEEIKE